MREPDTVSLETVFDALPVGLGVVDPCRRIVLMNRACCDALALPLDASSPGTPVAEVVRDSVSSTANGPGDPAAVIRSALLGQLHRRRRYRVANRSFDLVNTPLPAGGYLISSFETTRSSAAAANALPVADASTVAKASTARAQTAAALAALPVGLATFDPDRRLLFANPRFAALLGLPAERLVAGSSFEAMLSLLAARPAGAGSSAGGDDSALMALLRQGTPGVAGLVRCQRRDALSIDISFDPLPGGGCAISVVETAPQDHAEAEEFRRARLLDLVLLNVPHGICVYGPDLRVVLFNEVYSTVMAGAPLRVGDSLAAVIRRRAEAGEYGAGEPEAIIAAQMGHDITRPQSRRRLRPNGTAINTRTAPLPDGGYISVVTDISALVHAEDELRQRAGEMSTMLGNARHGIMLWGSDRRLVASNPVVARLLDLPPDLLTPGCAEAEVVESLVRLRHFGSDGAAESRARVHLQLDRSVPFEREITTGSGRVLHAQSNPAPDGGWISTFTDITHMRETESELRRAKERAEAANLAKSRFLATMSHELRTPLNAIIGFSDALAGAPGDVAADLVVDYGGQINIAGKQLLSLINIILDVARIDSGGFEPDAEIADIATSVRTAVRQADSAAQAGAVAIELKLAADLPWLRGDERRITQALSQLLSNAIKFTPAGGLVTVEAGLTPEAELFVSVADCGIGIPATDLERVFEPFTQLDASLSRRYGGTGLGLFAARAVVLAHGGQLHLTSRPGFGTTARMTLPRSRILHQAER